MGGRTVGRGRFVRQLYSGDHGEYRTIRALGDGAYGLTFEAVVEDAHLTVDARPPATKLSPGLKVVIKIPRIDPVRFAGQANQGRLSRIYDSFVADFIASQYLVDVRCVAHILDTGRCRVDLGHVVYPGAPFSVQEFVEGQRLDEYWRRWQTGGRRFRGIRQPDEFFEWAVRLTEAIQQVHQRGVVHGDIWPKNIMVDAHDRPVLIDFGQASLRDVSLPPRDEANPHGYMAPEKGRQVSGDIYSLGGVLYKLATGDDPPVNEIVDDRPVLNKRTVSESLRRRNPELVRGNRGIADVIARCLRHAEEDRARSAQDVLEDIEDFWGRTPSSAIPRLTQRNQRSVIASISNQLFQVMARRMVTTLDQALIDMGRGFAEITGDHQELVRGLMEYLSILKEGDIYRTLSEPRLWRSGNLGVNGRFLTMNALAAETGASIERIFMITSRELKSPRVLELVQAHYDVMEEISPGASTLHEPTAGGGYWAAFRVVKKEARALEERKLSHFGLMARGQSEVWVFPTYRKNGTLVTLQFSAGVARADDLKLYYEQQKKKALPLSEFPRLRRRRTRGSR